MSIPAPNTERSLDCDFMHEQQAIQSYEFRAKLTAPGTAGKTTSLHGRRAGKSWLHCGRGWLKATLPLGSTGCMPGSRQRWGRPSPLAPWVGEIIAEQASKPRVVEDSRPWWVRLLSSLCLVIKPGKSFKQPVKEIVVKGELRF